MVVFCIFYAPFFITIPLKLLQISYKVERNMLDNFIIGSSALLIPFNILMLALGTCIGIFIGALPGLTSSMAIVIILPLTYKMGIVPALCILMGIYMSSKLGGSFTAIIIRTPGTPAAACTALDGYPMAQKGYATKALGYAVFASTIGGFFGWIPLFAFTPFVAKIALKFTNADIALVSILGLFLISSFGSKGMLKGFICTAIGLLMAIVGMDPLTGFARLTFGNSNLLEGVPFLPATIGFFALAVVLGDIASKKNVSRRVLSKNMSVKLPNFVEIKSVLRLAGISSLFGMFIGAIPGIGAETAAWIAYGGAKSSSKHPELYGTGIPEGIVAPESANNAVCGGAFIPMLTLGIPGDPSTALMLAALMLHGIRVGPTFFEANGQLSYVLIMGLLFSIILMFVIGLASAKYFIYICNQEMSLLLPIILVLAIVGAYASTNNVFAIVIVIVTGCIGYVLERLDFPITYVVVALILGPIIEYNFRIALRSSRGNLAVFISSWPAGITLGIMIIILILKIVKNIKYIKNKDLFNVEQ